MDTIRVGLVGDYKPDLPAHTSIPRAFSLVSTGADLHIDHVWLPTRALQMQVGRLLDECDGIWCVPGSPYESVEGFLSAIQFAREQERPFLSSGSGFEYTILEFMRNVVGMMDAAHAEVALDAKSPVISLLEKPLLGTTEITVVNGTRFASLYGELKSTEAYYCSFGLNSRYLQLLESHGMRASAIGSDGNVHGVELTTHPYFLATLYYLGEPAMQGRVHPLVMGFVRACCEEKRKRTHPLTPESTPPS